jgi:hypothetical protein
MIIGAVLLPILQTNTLDKYLIEQLFKRQDSHTNDQGTDIGEHALLKSSRHAIVQRKSVRVAKRVPLFEHFVRLVCWVCRRRHKPSQLDLFARKAQYRLRKEFDIVTFVKRYRNIWNMLKHLTSRRERKLVKMQADRNVIHISDAERQFWEKRMTVI